MANASPDVPDTVEKLVKACEKAKAVESVQACLRQNPKWSGTKGAIHKASQQGHREIVKLFFNHNVDVNLLDDDESAMARTALHHAAERGRREVVDLLIKKHADVTLSDKRGQTALHLASEKGHTGIVKTLLDAARREVKLLVGKANTDGRTALHLAVQGANKDVVKLLLDKMDLQSLKIESKGGNTAFDYASKNGNKHKEVAKLLKDHITKAAGDARAVARAKESKVSKAEKAVAAAREEANEATRTAEEFESLAASKALT